MKTIVVGYDGSEHSDRALDRAIQLADEGAELIVVSAAGLTRSGGMAGSGRPWVAPSRWKPPRTACV